MFCFVYYDPDSDAVNRFRDWERVWSAGGWVPRILTRRMAFKDRRAKTAPVDKLPWLALLSQKVKNDTFCDSLNCRPNNAAGVFEVTNRDYVETRC